MYVQLIIIFLLYNNIDHDHYTTTDSMTSPRQHKQCLDLFPLV